MKRTCLIILLIIINIVAIGAFTIWFCNRNYPMIGQDNRLFMPYMLDSFLHQNINGLNHPMVHAQLCRGPAGLH